ncbi:hypothetical protein Tco_1183299 [Tanacetum coccineum]
MARQIKKNGKLKWMRNNRSFAERLQRRKRATVTIEERAKFLHDTIAAQRKFLAQQRSRGHKETVPPTKSIKKTDDDLLNACGELQTF